MNFLFLTNFIFSLAIVALLSYGFIRLRQNRFLSKIIFYFSSIGVLYFLFAISSLLWFIGLLSFSQKDFLILYSIIIFLQGLLLFNVIVMISKNRKLRFFLFFYVISFIFFFYSGTVFFNSLLITSFLLLFLFFIDMTFRSDLYDRIGYIGMFYSFLGVVFQVFSVFWQDKLFLFSILMEAVFFLLAYLLLRDLKINPPLSDAPVSFGEKSHFFKVMGHLVFIIVITNLVFIGTIAVHEFGHFSVAQVYGCEAGRIVYENGYFHTEVLCRDDSMNFFVLLGGILLPLIVAGALFFSGGKFMKDIAILIAGFNLISISRDLSELGISNNLVLVSVFFGILLIVIGIIIFAKSRVEDDVYLPSSLEPK